MEPQNPNAKAFQRTAFWYLKFLFACYGAAIALLMLVVVISLPFSPDLLSDHARLLMLVFTLAVSPIVYRYLR